MVCLTGAIAHGQIQTHTLSHGGGLLKCTLAWDDEPATLPASLTLVNDLDLTLLSPANTIHLPWVLDKDNPANNATTGVNTVDTVEQVEVAPKRLRAADLKTTTLLLWEGRCLFLRLKAAPDTATPPVMFLLRRLCIISACKMLPCPG